VFEELGSGALRQTGDDGGGTAGVGDTIAPRPAGPPHPWRQHRPALARRWPTEEVDVETSSLRFGCGLCELWLVACAQAEIDVAAGLEAHVFAGEARQVLPDRLRPQCERKLGGVAALQPQIAEIDAAGGAAGNAFFEHQHASSVLTQEIGSKTADGAATNDHHIGAAAHGALLG